MAKRYKKYKTISKSLAQLIDKEGWVWYSSNSTMGERNRERGFTVAEMIVALIVMSLFLTMFFQTYSTNESQRLAIARRAAAYDIATTNLSKISTKTGLPPCDGSATSSNNLATNSTLAANPSTGGDIIATNKPGGTPTWATAGALAGATDGIAIEPLTDTPLPSDTTQELRVLYPQGCPTEMPVTIVSIVSYGSESVRRAAFVN